jgi:hypothetical protein
MTKAIYENAAGCSLGTALNNAKNLVQLGQTRRPQQNFRWFANEILLRSRFRIIFIRKPVSTFRK